MKLPASNYVIKMSSHTLSLICVLEYFETEQQDSFPKAHYLLPFSKAFESYCKGYVIFLFREVYSFQNHKAFAILKI
jgi:hypothetical protein